MKFSFCLKLSNITFSYTLEISRDKQKKVNMLNVLRFVIWEAVYEYICIVIDFLLNIYTFIYVSGGN